MACLGASRGWPFIIVGIFSKGIFVGCLGRVGCNTHFEVLLKEGKQDPIKEYVVAYEVGRIMYD